MGNLSAHFDRSEFACKDGCGFDSVDTMTLALLEDVRENFGQPITITSGCRCAAYNEQINGSASSLHMQARAADFVVAGVPAATVQAFLKFRYHDTFGIGSYDAFTHIDTRSGFARWSG